MVRQRRTLPLSLLWGRDLHRFDQMHALQTGRSQAEEYLLSLR